jgi:hypothetical protein
VIRERRNHARIVTKGALVMHVAGVPQHGRIVDISAGGVSVLTSVTPPERWLARMVDLELRLDGASAEWLTGTARVLRIRADGLALAFTTMPPALVRILDELGHAARTRRRRLVVVLIDTDPVRRAAMMAGFREVGCTVVEAASPLEAIVRLGEATFEPDVIAIADSHPAGAADDLRAFARQNHPHAKLVTIVDEQGIDGLANWVASADPHSDLAQRIRDMLSRVLTA